MADIFKKATSKVPTSVGTITVTLSDDGANKSASYLVEVKDQSGGVMRVPGDVGDLVPYLATADLNVLIVFMTKLRGMAVAGFIP